MADPSQARPSSDSVICSSSEADRLALGALELLGMKQTSEKMTMDLASSLGLATIVVIDPGYGVLSLMSNGALGTFDQHSKLALGTLEVAILTNVFRLGDVLNVDAVGPVQHATCEHVLFHATHLSWVRSGTQSQVPTFVGHGVLLSREPEPIFGISNHRHVDASANTFCNVPQPENFSICRTVLLRYHATTMRYQRYHQACAIAPLPSTYHERITFVASAGVNMVAIGDGNATIWVPCHALRYRGIQASDDLCGTTASALVSSILPYENPGPIVNLDLPEPAFCVYLLFLPEPED